MATVPDEGFEPPTFGLQTAGIRQKRLSLLGYQVARECTTGHVVSVKFTPGRAFRASHAPHRKAPSCLSPKALSQPIRASSKRETTMHGLDIRNLSIEALASLRDDTVKLLAEKIGGRERELLGEVERIKGLISAKPSAGGKAKPKYRLNGNEWSGRGSQPAWVKAHLDGGGSLEDLKA
jgi:hypothetical protein